MDVTDLLHLKAALEADRIVKTSSDEEDILCIWTNFPATEALWYYFLECEGSLLFLTEIGWCHS